MQQGLNSIRSPAAKKHQKWRSICSRRLVVAGVDHHRRDYRHIPFREEHDFRLSTNNACYLIRLFWACPQSNGWQNNACADFLMNSVRSSCRTGSSLNWLFDGGGGGDRRKEENLSFVPQLSVSFVLLTKNSVWILCLSAVTLSPPSSLCVLTISK